MNTSSHSLLSVLAANGVDRVFLVPGESYLGILDALNEFPQIDVVTCRHEAGAGFMACADGRLTRRPGVVLVSRGPGATNASIAVHTAQQDAIPLILIVGQIPKKDLRKEAFQEIDYHHMFGRIAKWVVEATDPEQLSEIAFKAVRMATAGTPGPVVIVLPEDVQQQAVTPQSWVARPNVPTTATPSTVDQIKALITGAERPLIIAGGAFDKPGGRESLLAFAEGWQIPVAVSFRRHDIFPNTHALYAGDLGLSNPSDQMGVFHSSDLILALGTRLDDITSQGYTFPKSPQPAQALVHCYPDPHIVGLHFAPEIGLVCDPVSLVADLMPPESVKLAAARESWNDKVRSTLEGIASWPSNHSNDLSSTAVAHAIERLAPADTIVCLDAGVFAAPVYRHFRFAWPQRLMAPISGAMGYGMPAAVASQLRFPHRKVICMVGDGGFMMTGNEMITAIERRLPVVVILLNNGCYGSIRVHQDRNYPGRHLGTSLFNPDFASIASAFGMPVRVINETVQIGEVIGEAMRAEGPFFIEVKTNLPAARLPASVHKEGANERD
ncbi:thiamine pyrophosphate-dependent enzyme [Pusillimonas sp. ANT_WB101]|uniref:thiamine pyrophosphate-dependent enzyme n=1 Tax=Pusillimonas sp. ANT_WB101 TaxID=2597356 RepID=UPI0011EDE3C8|nr:thiamine pyrophosphate-dependent enzyme [Pusillimonas sp. ANT_WB101]KAA0890868.1 pyruvate decarboxylase [Pusillimonas sp. ANT_WB101]